MTSYFDEKAVEQRVSRSFRRRLFWAIHLVIILGLAGLLIADAAWMGYWGRWAENFTVGLFFSIPFFFHTVYFAYRELYERTLQGAMQQARMEAILEREEKRKRDHLEQPAPSLVYLSDDGELVDYEEEDDLSNYPQRRKRG